MKYGAALRQNSIPAWAHHNVDYDDVKHYIKENTTAGNGNSISIPGAGDVRGKELEDNLYGILQQQHQRITLFVRSKTGEIERRLDHLRKQTTLLSSKPAVNGRIPAKRLEKYGRLEADILKAGDELQCLSRFSKAQQTAFRKLLKKHKKWTGSTDLETEFNTHVTGDPSSFTNIDLNPIYTEYEDTLSTLRTLYHERINGAPSKFSVDADVQDSFTQIRSVIESSSSVEFDSYFSTSPLGRGGKNAVYWVHPDNIVELQILILQHARSFPTRALPSATISPTLSRQNSITSSPSRRNSSTVEADTTVLVADDLESFIAHQSSSTFEKREDTVGSRLQEATVHARWTKTEDAIVTAKVNDRDIQKVSVKRKNVFTVLESSSPTSARRSSITQDKNRAAAEHMQTWIAQQRTIKPLTTIATNRSRFAETATDSSGFILATLDKNIRMRKAESLASSPEDTFSQAMSAEFPFAVLRVRQEGFGNSTLIKVLDQSHLVERVRGFSLEYHSVWYCCQPENVVPPFWVPLMQRDIRKVATLASRRRAYNHDSSYGSQSTTPQMTPSTGSVGDYNGGDLTAVEEQSPHRIQIPDQLETPPLSAFRKKRKSAYDRAGSALPKQAYWSEYDDPSGSEDEGAYVLYIDPNEVSSATKTWRRIRSLWSKDKPSDHEALLGHDGANERGMTEESVSSSEDEAHVPKRTQQRSYGTLNQPRNQTTGYNSELHHQQTDWVTQLAATCLVASVLLLCIGYILVATGKRKLASEVDAGVVLAVASSLAFAVSGMGAVFGRQTPRWPIATLVIGIMVIDVAAASMLLVWAFG
ncbi:hypothetical protein E4T49_08105 [Aureobasidium sp. EXF-10728]|nr:hypothetical protein E4T49_08105 [Aureobasidium sp. EXF-10728]